MPTTLPHRVAGTKRATQAKYSRSRLFARLAPIAAVILYLLLLASTVGELEADFSAIFVPVAHHGEYNPMEPVGRSGGERPERLL